MKKLSYFEIADMVKKYAIEQKRSGVSCSDDFKAVEFYEAFNSYGFKYDFSNISDSDVELIFKDVIDW